MKRQKEKWLRPAIGWCAAGSFFGAAGGIGGVECGRLPLSAGIIQLCIFTLLFLVLIIINKK